MRVYTCRKIVYEKLQKKLGQPTKIYYTQGQISGASWDIPFNEKRKLTAVLSRPLLIGQVKSKK